MSDITPFSDPDDDITDEQAQGTLDYAQDPNNVLFPSLTPLGEMIRRLRRARRMSQQRLAEGIGSLRGQPHISAIENGVIPDPDTVIRIANALQVDPAVLLRARLFEQQPQDIEYEADPRLGIIWNRMANFDPNIQNAIFIVFDGIIRLAEAIIDNYSSTNS